jgi:hypothetical protein
VLRYGQTIGLANRPIPAGTWVREETIDMPQKHREATILAQWHLLTGVTGLIIAYNGVGTITSSPAQTMKWELCL